MYDNEYAYQSLLLVMVVRADILPSLASWPAVIRHDVDIQAMTSTSPKQVHPTGTGLLAKSIDRTASQYSRKLGSDLCY